MDVIYKNIVAALSCVQHVDGIILFGSRARGDAKERSDIDIAITGAALTSSDWLQLCEKVDTIPTLLEIDLVRLDTAPAELKDVISREGVTLYERQ